MGRHVMSRSAPVAHDETPPWQPIDFLPELAPMIDGMLDSAEDRAVDLQPLRPGLQHHPR